MNAPWRLVDSPALSPPRSAAVDEAVLECHVRGLVPNTLHFYTRSKPTVSVGRFQKIDETVAVEECRRRGVAIIRRRSGGGSIYTDPSQLIFALVASQRTLGATPSESFEMICGAVAKALRGFGAEARHRPINDVEVDGRKVSGSAQLRRRGSVLHHGTILVDTDLETMNAVLRGRSTLPSTRVTTLSALLAEPPAIGAIKRSMEAALAVAFDVQFVLEELVEAELKLVDEYVGSHYGNDEWNLRP